LSDPVIDRDARKNIAIPDITTEDRRSSSVISSN